MDQSSMHLFNENDTRRIFLPPHAFYHHFHYGGPHSVPLCLAGLTDGMV